MRGRATEKSSILLLSRNTVVIGAMVITALSFVLGYFLGYKGGGISEGEEPAAELVREGEAARLEEKEVMESPAAQEPAGDQQASSQRGQVPPAPLIGPGEIVPEVAPPRLADAAASEAVREQAQRKKEAEKLQGAPEVQGAESAEGQGAGEEKEGGTQKAHPLKNAAEGPNTGKQGREKTTGKTSPTAGTATGKMYTVQVGAFPGREGAEQLLQNLLARGYKPYIVDAGQGAPYFRVRIGAYKDRKEAERNAVAFSKKTGLPNFVTQR